MAMLFRKEEKQYPCMPLPGQGGAGSTWGCGPSLHHTQVHCTKTLTCNIRPDLTTRIKHEALPGLHILTCRKRWSHFPCVFLHQPKWRNVCHDVVRSVWLPPQPSTGYPGSLLARASCISFLTAKTFPLPASTQPSFSSPWNIPASESSYPQNSGQKSAHHVLLFIWRKQWATGLPTGS